MVHEGKTTAIYMSGVWEILSVTNSRSYSSNVHVHVENFASIWVWMDSAGFVFPWFLHVVQVRIAGLSEVFLDADKIVEP